MRDPGGWYPMDQHNRPALPSTEEVGPKGTGM